MELIDRLAQAIIALETEKAETLVKDALEKGVDPLKVLQEGILAALSVVGQKFETREYFLAELIQSGEIGKKCVALITPYLPKTGAARARTVVVGTVKDDIHDIGKNLVIAQLRIHGFEVYDLGIDIPSMTFIDKAQEVGADIIGMSAFLTTTIPYFSEVLSYLRDMGLRDKYKVIIGGGTTSAQYAESIGADGWGANAIEAVNVCKRLLGL